jgi:predicted GH43/DUF377 family glycosyl hydrolase
MNSPTIGDELPTIPWEEKPADCIDMVWRFNRNPVVDWNPTPKAVRMFNSAVVPYNRNGVLFPRKINTKYLLFSHPIDSGHTPFGNIYLNESPDRAHWGRHRFVMGKNTLSAKSNVALKNSIP